MRRLWFLVAAAVAACGGKPAPAPVAPAPVAASPAPAAAAPAPEHAEHAEHHGHGPLGHRFADADRWAKVFDDPARDAWQKPDAVVAQLGLAPGMVVADVGAGTGYFEGRLSHAVGAGGKVLATDIEPDMIHHLEHRAQHEGWANVTAVLSTTDDPALPAGGVDRILIVGVWHHVPDRAAFAGKLAAALRPGGQIAIVDFKKTSPHGPPPAHRLAPDVVAADLAGVGLTTEVRADVLPDQYIVIGTRK